MAATGGMRPARKAGTIAAATVTPIPITIDKMTVRLEINKSAAGNAAPAALNAKVMPLATPSPPTRPRPVAMIPTTRPSPIIIW